MLYYTVVEVDSRPVSAAPNLPRLRRPSTSRHEHARRLSFSALFAILLLVVASTASAQQVDSTPHLGLAASSALSIHGGVSRIKHASLGTEVGGALDLGWIGAQWARVSLGVDYLALVVDRPDSLGVRERGKGYVFTAFADMNAMASLTRRVSGYGGVGFGVDAVGVNISNEQIGSIYNTNVFDVHAQAGALLRLTPRGHVTVEARVTGARIVRRLGLRAGYTWFYNQLPTNR